MYYTAEFWSVDLWGNPVKKKYQVPPEPIYWPTSPSSILIRAYGEVAEDIIARAEALGWEFNRNTGTFYRP
jgi:hypothetical protein